MLISPCVETLEVTKLSLGQQTLIYISYVNEKVKT